ncbi:hypothetical protein F0344_09135 [Streptomyces finlayi]|uniref:GAF domain-containing protein n=1 Tax=Streptomyces finlayi TaxID=67296 RepID=A0A7G7BHD4_9ACTN|nr:hypothetical protein F0344_09135 [Streptomyces finlayi]
MESDLSAARQWRQRDPEHGAKVMEYGIHSLISVPLHARGVVLGMANFWRAGNAEPAEVCSSSPSSPNAGAPVDTPAGKVIWWEQAISPTEDD